MIPLFCKIYISKHVFFLKEKFLFFVCFLFIQIYHWWKQSRKLRVIKLMVYWTVAILAQVCTVPDDRIT